MTSFQPTQPLADAELAAIRGAIERTDLFEEDTLPLAFTDRKRLLAEVDRLRAENTAQATTLAAVRAPHKPSAFKVFGRTYCEACGQDAGVWPTVTDRALGLDQDGGSNA